MHFEMYHYNITVSDLEKSLSFYNKAFSLIEVKRKEREGYTIVFLKNDDSSFCLELTCFKNHPEKYDLGENETHLGIRTSNFSEAHALHKSMDIICLENTDMGLYFVEDPDGYWIEIVPVR